MMVTLKLFVLVIFLTACTTAPQRLSSQTSEGQSDNQDYDNAEEYDGVSDDDSSSDEEDDDGAPDDNFDNVDTYLDETPKCTVHYAKHSEQSEITNNQTDKGYFHSYHRYAPGPLRDDTDRHEEGKIINPGTAEEELVVMGEYSYKIGPYVFFVEYTADKNGYRTKTHSRKYSCIVFLSPPSPKVLGSR